MSKFLFIASAMASVVALDPPAMPGKYQLTLSWTRTVKGQPVYKYAHQRWYDLPNQLYRDDTLDADNLKTATDSTVEKPDIDHQLYDMDFLRKVCTNRVFVSRIDGFIQSYNNETCVLETLTHMGTPVKAMKCTKQLVAYTISDWYAHGDKNLKDGTPLQQYNSYDESNGFSVTTISDYTPTFPVSVFDLTPECAALKPATPAPTPKPTNVPHWMRDWSKTACSCIHVNYTAGYMTEADCMKAECK